MELSLDSNPQRFDAKATPPSDAARGRSAGAEDVAQGWLVAGAPHVRSVLHFGSTRSGASPTGRSAHDLFVLVDDYEGFYRAVRAALPGTRSPSFLARANRILPPNVLHGVSAAGDAKLFILSERDLASAVGPRARDHFVRARLAQDVAVCAAADTDAARDAETALGTARRGVVQWMRPFLEGPFDGPVLARRMLEVSYASEIRPEARGRVQEVFASQRAFLEREYTAVVEEAARQGRLVAAGQGRFAYARPAGVAERAAARLWFARSRARATLRWAKYVATFEGWLDYVAAKVERRTGMRVELTARERRWPWILLWPKFFRVMGARRASSSREANR